MKKTIAFFSAYQIWGYALFLVFTVALLAGFLHQGEWLQTDLRTLLPSRQGVNAVLIEADKRQEQQLNRQLIALVGHTDPEQAFTLAEETAQVWQTSGDFAQVNAHIQPDLNQLRQEIQQLAWATLPEHIQEQLLRRPAEYFQHYAQQLANPFEQTNLLPLEQDWLGFGRFAINRAQIGRLQWNATNGMLSVTQDGLTWVLLRGELNAQTWLNPAAKLTTLLEQNRRQLEAREAHFLVAGNALFAADAKQKAERESTLMSLSGISLTLLLLWRVFRTWRILWLFLPIVVGMTAGIAATLLVFRHIHILTIVVGTSLVGVLIDFPLHWFAGSLFRANWQARPAMAKLRFTFTMSLLVTLLGYGLLAFTDLPVLKQTALFSAVALIAAVWTTQLLLPFLIGSYQVANRLVDRKGYNKVRAIFEKFAAFQGNRGFTVLLLCFTAVGIYRSQWQDDIRSWVSMPKTMLEEMRQIGQLTGFDWGAQAFLICAENDDELLEKSTALAADLTARGVNIQALSEWFVAPQRQQMLARQISATIRPADYAPLTELGIPQYAVVESLRMLAEQPPLSLQAALSTTLGQAWRPYYLGRLNETQVAGLVKVKEADSAEMAKLANQQDIFWLDKRASLNHGFQMTRNQAAWLKVLSFVLAALLLRKWFNGKTTLRLLLVPCVAIVLTVALCGWIGLPIGLFPMFGLLLVSAIGIDYAVYMQTVRAARFEKQFTLFLAATTTLISFALLGMSSTPAVAGFGLTVTLGVLLSMLCSAKFIR